MIRVLIVDDHPALRAGLTTVLRGEPGLVVAGECAGDEEGLWPTLKRTCPDVVLLDYHLPRSDGLQLCYRMTRATLPPRVIVYTAHAPALALPAAVAGAHALVDKALPARELFEIIRRVARGERVLPAISDAEHEAAAQRVRTQDRAVLGMLLHDTAPADIAIVTRTSPEDVRNRTQRILAELRPNLPARV
jgi:DNA-binding NarL/FixJ family response regulator